MDNNSNNLYEAEKIKSNKRTKFIEQSKKEY
jgi:hypothetical protein